MNSLDNKDEIKVKSKMITMTIFSVIGSIIVLIFIGIFSVKYFLSELPKSNYHILEINQNNKDKIKSLVRALENECCESIYKIEYNQNLMNEKNVMIYCKDEEDIQFTVVDRELTDYIFEYGTTEKR